MATVCDLNTYVAVSYTSHVHESHACQGYTLRYTNRFACRAKGFLLSRSKGGQSEQSWKRIPNDFLEIYIFAPSRCEFPWKGLYSLINWLPKASQKHDNPRRVPRLFFLVGSQTIQHSEPSINSYYAKFWPLFFFF